MAAAFSNTVQAGNPHSSVVAFVWLIALAGRHTLVFIAFRTSECQSGRDDATQPPIVHARFKAAPHHTMSAAVETEAQRFIRENGPAPRAVPELDEVSPCA